MLHAPSNLAPTVKMAVVCPPEDASPHNLRARLPALLDGATERYLNGISSTTRARDFLLGRLAAYEALAALGVTGSVDRNGDSRAPRWPAGVVGSIAHTSQSGHGRAPAHGVAVSCVAHRHTLRHLGVDVEATERSLSPAAATRIATPWERERLTQTDSTPSAALKLFCAKEALYKAYAAHAAHPLHFHHAELLLDPASESFTGTLDLGHARIAVGGGFSYVERYLIAWSLDRRVEAVESDSWSS